METSPPAFRRSTANRWKSSPKNCPNVPFRHRSPKLYAPYFPLFSGTRDSSTTPWLARPSSSFIPAFRKRRARICPLEIHTSISWLGSRRCYSVTQLRFRMPGLIWTFDLRRWKRWPRLETVACTTESCAIEMRTFSLLKMANIHNQVRCLPRYGASCTSGISFAAISYTWWRPTPMIRKMICKYRICVISPSKIH